MALRMGQSDPVDRAVLPSCTRRRTGYGRAMLGTATSIRIRPIRPTDRSRLRAFYEQLSAKGRALRFCGASRGISEADSARFCTPDHDHREGFVAQLVEAGARHGTIVGHLCLEPAGDGSAEVAIAVADEFQRRGIGRRLLSAGLSWARHRGIRALVATMLEGNVPVYRLLASLALPYRCRRVGGGELVMTIELAAEPLAA